MGQKKQSSADPAAEPKKRRRVGFSSVGKSDALSDSPITDFFNRSSRAKNHRHPLDFDTGIEADDCIKIYLVSSKGEVGALDSFCISPIDLNGFFEEDGKIYGYQGLKITIWISSLTFHTYADITFQSSSDGVKGITDLKSCLQKIFGETLVVSKDEFLRTFSGENHLMRTIVSEGERLEHKVSNGHVADSNTQLGAASSDVEVIRLAMSNTAAGHLYSRLVPLVLLLIDGSNPIDVTDPGWELYVLIQKNNDDGNIQRLLGFSAVYRFYHYPESTRLRLGQILVLPPYQHKGYGRQLVEELYNVAVSEDVYDLTVEAPVDYLQHLRTSLDIERLVVFGPIQEAVNSAVSLLKQGKLSKKTHIPRLVPPPKAVEDVRKTFKINKKQFLQCWEILIYLGLHPVDKYMEDFVTIISNRIKGDILGKDSGSGGKKVVEVQSEYNSEMSFIMFRSQDEQEPDNVQTDEDQRKQEEQLQQLVDERVKEIQLIAQKMHRG